MSILYLHCLILLHFISSEAKKPFKSNRLQSALDVGIVVLSIKVLVFESFWEILPKIVLIVSIIELLQ